MSPGGLCSPGPGRGWALSPCPPQGREWLVSVSQELLCCRDGSVGTNPPNLSPLPQQRVRLVLHAGEAEEEQAGAAGGEAMAEPGGAGQRPAGAAPARQVGAAPPRDASPALSSPSPAHPCPPAALARLRGRDARACAQPDLRAAQRLSPACCLPTDPEPVTPPAGTQNQLRWPQPRW